MCCLCRCAVAGFHQPLESACPDVDSRPCPRCQREAHRQVPAGGRDAVDSGRETANVSGECEPPHIETAKNMRLKLMAHGEVKLIWHVTTQLRIGAGKE